jgi:hypothetical protein
MNDSSPATYLVIVNCRMKPVAVILSLSLPVYISRDMSSGKLRERVTAKAVSRDVCVCYKETQKGEGWKREESKLETKSPVRSNAFKGPSPQGLYSF